MKTPIPVRRYGFTLDERAAVVLSIGILATLTVPAIARALPTAFTRRFTDVSTTSSTLGDLIGSEKYRSGLSSGNVLLPGSGAVDFPTMQAAAKRNSASDAASANDCGLLLTVESGSLLKKSATSPDQIAAYG